MVLTNTISIVAISIPFYLLIMFPRNLGKFPTRMDCYYILSLLVIAIVSVFWLSVWSVIIFKIVDRKEQK